MTRDRILAAAERLMTEHGYAATSVDQVIAAASSSKGAFFHHFRSKADLAGQVLERYVRADLAYLEAGLASIADLEDPVERAVGLFRFFEDGADELIAEQSACLYATVLAEREFVGGDFHEQVADATRAWRVAIVDVLEPALATRGGRTEVDVTALADHLYTTFEGGYILCRTIADRKAMRGQLKVLRQLVEALLRAEAA